MAQGRQNSWARIPQSKRDALRRAVFERDGWRCQIRAPGCTGGAEELDHVTPRRSGGAVFDPANARASCRECNRGRRPAREISIAGASRKW